jgi:hypothetical protein
MRKAKEAKPKRKHATILRIRFDIADALDRLHWETGRAKSAVICEAVLEYLKLRELLIRGGCPRLVNSPATQLIRRDPKPESRIMDELEAAEDPRSVTQ